MRSAALLLLVLFLPAFARADDGQPPGTIARLGQPSPYHGGAGALLFSPDGKQAITCAPLAGTARVWDLATGKEVRRLTLAAKPNAVFGFAADGKTIIGVNLPGALVAFDSETGKETEVGAGRKGASGTIGISSDGRWAMRLLQDGAVLVWDVAGKQEVRQVIAASADTRVVPGKAPNVGISNDGKVLFLCRHRLEENKLDPDRRYEFTSTVDVFDGETGKRLHHADLDLKLPNTGFVMRPGAEVPGPAALAPDGKMLAVVRPGKKIALIEADGKPIRTLDVKRGLPLWVTFSPDGKVVGAMVSGSLRVWETDTGKELLAPEGMWGVADVKFAPDGKHVAALRTDGLLDAWDIATGKSLRPLAPGSITAVALAPDEKRFATLGRDGLIRLWDIEAKKQAQAWRGHAVTTGFPNFGPNLGFAPDGKSLLSCGSDSTLALWDLAAEEPTTLWGPGHPSGPFRTAFFSEDGKTVIAQRTVGEWLVLDSKTGDPKGNFPGNQFSTLLDDTRHLISATAEGEVVVRDLTTGREVYRLGAGGRKKGLAAGEKPPAVGVVRQNLTPLGLSPDGRTVAVAEMNVGQLKEIKFWEVATGLERGRLSGDATASVRFLTQWQFAPDSRSAMALEGFVFQGNEQPFHRWDVAQGSLIRREATPAPTAFRYFADGRRWLAAYPDGTILLREDKVASPKERTDREKEALYADLSSRDGAKAFQARLALADVPEVVEWLDANMRPVAVDAAAVRQRIADLSAADETADKAAAELARLGDSVVPYLREEWGKKPMPAARKRIETLFANFDDPANVSESRLRALRGVEVLEALNTPAARRLLEKWAVVKEGEPAGALARDARAALDRLARRPGAESR